MEEKILNDILETVGFLKDNMVSKEDLAQGLDSVRAEMVTKIDLAREVGSVRAEMNQGFGSIRAEMTEMKSGIMTHMDGFIGLHQKLDTELVALRAKYDRLEDYVHQLARHANVELK